MEKEDKKDTLHISKQQFKYHWNSHQKKSRPEDSGTFLECWKEKEEREKKKKKKGHSRILYPVKVSFTNGSWLKAFSGKRKPREFITSRPVLEEMLKEASQAKRKW